MFDKQWLYRVYVAYKVYKDLPNNDKQSVDHFVRYLYQQYGIIFPDDINNDKQSQTR